jgi:hypothetical protein
VEEGGRMIGALVALYALTVAPGAAVLTLVLWGRTMRLRGRA